MHELNFEGARLALQGAGATAGWTAELVAGGALRLRAAPPVVTLPSDLPLHRAGAAGCHPG